MSRKIIRINFTLNIEGNVPPMLNEVSENGEKISNPLMVPTFSFKKDGSIFSRRDNEEDMVEPERDWVDREVDKAIKYSGKENNDIAYVSVIRIKNKPKEVGIVCSDYPMSVEEVEIKCVSTDREEYDG